MDIIPLERAPPGPRALESCSRTSRAAELNLVHGIPNTPVDIYVVKKLTDVNFGTAADLNSAFPAS
jgi:hypothetical protein